MYIYIKCIMISTRLFTVIFKLVDNLFVAKHFVKAYPLLKREIVRITSHFAQCMFLHFPPLGETERYNVYK